MAQSADRVGFIAPCNDVLMPILLLRTAAYWLIAAVSFLGGCTAWRGELPPTHVRSVEKQVRDIGLTDLGSHSRQIPRTVEDDLDSVRQRRAPKSEVLAPQVLALSVGDLRLKTLRNNLNLNVVFVEPEIARTMISKEEAKFDATFFGGARYTRQDLPKLDRDLVEFSSDKEELDGAKVKLTQIEQTKEAVKFDFGIKIPLPTGGNVMVQNLFDENNKLSPQRFEQHRAALEFSLSHPLLRDAGVEANTASIRLARLRFQEVTAKTKLSAIRVLASAEKAYWRLYGAHRMLDVHSEQYTRAYENLELVRKRVQEGLSPRIEIVRAEVGVARRLESLIVAEANVRIQERELKRILNIEGITLDSVTRIDPTSSPDLLRYDLDRKKVAADALANRMEMLEIELKLAADAIRIDLARNRALPLFVLDFGYGILDRQGAFGSSWGGMWDFDNNELTIGVRGEIPLTNEARKSQLRRALLSRAQRLATRAQRELGIRQEVYDTLDILDQNWQRILAARQNVIVTGVNYDAELKQFEEGLRTMREVLEALTQLGDAQIRELQAIVAYQAAQIDLAFATGTLLGYTGVRLGPVPLVN